jgi:hypothetical protein
MLIMDGDGQDNMHAQAQQPVADLFFSPDCSLAAQKGRGKYGMYSILHRPLHEVLKFSSGIYKSERTNIKVRAGGSRVAQLLLHFLLVGN